jgi:hypothetical protein
MTDREINIAIAEFCGWKPSDPRGNWCHPSNWSLAKNGAYSVWVGSDKLPNYVEDLNAMHEAESILSHALHVIFRKLLWEEIQSGRDDDDAEQDERYFVSATASQRAESFLRTLGIWVEQ